MLKFFAPKFPPRTTASHLTTIHLDNGRSQLIFNDSNNAEAGQTPSQISPYLVINHLPPALSPPEDPHTPNSSLCPPFHIHLKEDETFHVISGTAKFLLLDQQQQHNHRTKHDDASTTTTSPSGVTSRLAPANSTVTIPQGQIHTFRNASTTDSLVIEFGFSPPSSTISSATNHGIDANTEKAKLHAKMHRFFRNTQLYRSDCSAHNLPRAMSQVLLFNYHADVALVPPFLLALHQRFPLFRGLIERVVAPALGCVMNVIGGVVLGSWWFGFRASYPEYCRPSLAGPESIDESFRDMAKERKTDASWKKEPPEVLCQAWRDHNFDGQSEE